MKIDWRTRRIVRRYVFVLGALMVSLPLLLASQAAADHVTLDNPPTFNYVNDEDCSKPVNNQCPDDQPGQKDLSAHAVATPSPGELWVSWKWDITSLSGNNTGDACALFDTDSSGSGVGRVDFAICVTIGGPNAEQLPNSPRVYTCGDAKVDRCTSTVTQQTGIHSVCVVAQPPNSDPFHAGEADTVATCHVHLGDVGGNSGTSNLVNTCSYPSEQPNSAPSDCVLIPRDAFIRIAKVIDVSANVSFAFNITPLPGNIGANPAVTHAFASGGVTTLTSSYLPIQSGVNHSVAEVVASGWEIDTSTGNAPVCTGSTVSNGNGSFSGSTISGLKAAEDNQITCTFKNKQQKGSAAIAKVDDTGAIVQGATFTVYFPAGTSNGVPTGTASGSCVTAAVTATCTIANLAPGTYTIDETPPSGYAKDATFPKSISIVAGQATNVSATDPRQFRAIVIVCRQHDSSLYSSAIKINGTSAGDSLTSAQATTAGLSAADQTAICGLTQGARSGLVRSGNDHSAAITIP